MSSRAEPILFAPTMDTPLVYLHDEEPPRWIVEGVSYLEKERNLKRRKK